MPNEVRGSSERNPDVPSEIGADDLNVRVYNEIEFNTPVLQKDNPVDQNGVIDFGDLDKQASPFGDTTGMPSPAQPDSALTDARLRASLGMAQIAPDHQVAEVADGFTRFDQTRALGLDPSATDAEIETAIQAKMRDNVGLPADASDAEYQQRLSEYNELSKTDSVGAHVRARLGLPPSATAEELSESYSAIEDAYRKASMGLKQIAPDSQVDSLFEGNTLAQRRQNLGLSPDATAEELDSAIKAKMRDNVGLPADATDLEYYTRLREYNELARTDSVGAHNRAEMALPPSATDEEVAQAHLRSIEASRRAMVGLPQGATDAQVDEAFKNYTPEGLRTTLGLPANATDEQVSAAIQAQVKENVGLPATATKTELSRRLAEYDALAQVDPVGAQMRADLGLAPSATFGEMLEAYGRRDEERRASR